MRLPKKQLPFFIVCLLLIVAACIFLVRPPGGGPEAPGQIIEIEQPESFFNQLPGVVFLYFGQAASAECAAFEPYLTAAVAESGWTVYYFDTTYWKDKAIMYDRILSSYQVDSVPLLVRTVDGEFAAAYDFDPDAIAAEVEAGLLAFFGPSGSAFPVVGSDGFPIGFVDVFQALTFFLILFNFLYLLLNRRALLRADSLRPLWGWVGNSTLVMVLRVLISQYSWAFGIHYNTGPASGFLSQVGAATQFLITPLLYLGLLILCVQMAYHKAWQRRSQKEAAV